MIRIEVWSGQVWEIVPIAYDIDRGMANKIAASLKRSAPLYTYRITETGQPPVILVNIETVRKII